MKFDVLVNGAKRSVDFDPARKEATIDGRAIRIDATSISPGSFSILLDGRSFEVSVEPARNGWLARTEGLEFQIEIVDPRAWRRGAGAGAGIELEGRQEIAAPMPGKIVRVLASPGDTVQAGQGLMVIEAMKMQNEIRAPKSGTIDCLAREGQTVNAGEILAVVV